MNWLSDSTLAHLREVAELPDLSGTKYELTGEIGRGGMGTVYLAVDRALDRHVALKVLHLSQLDGEAASRMRQEAHILARLEHPGIVPVHDVGALPDGRVYYAMKYVQGSRLDRHPTSVTSASDVLGIFERICDAVAFAHAHGVIHRDLKPENIMVGRFGEVLVMDWGVAKLLGGLDVGETTTVGAASRSSGTDAATAHGTVIGTPGYMAPEQSRGDVGRVDDRTDVYALGAILRFLVSRATEGGSSGFNRQVPRPLEAIWKKAMAVDPDARYRGVEALKDDVARYREGLAVAAYPEGPLDRARRFTVKYRTPILLVLTYLGMRLALLILAGV